MSIWSSMNGPPVIAEYEHYSHDDEGNGHKALIPTEVDVAAAPGWDQCIRLAFWPKATSGPGLDDEVTLSVEAARNLISQLTAAVGWIERSGA